MNDSKTLLPQHHSLKPWVGMHPNLRIVEKPEYENIDGTRVGFFPYAPLGRFHEMLSAENPINLAFAHQEFHGCVMAANTIASEHGDALPDFKVISGHIHGRQHIGNVWYPGTPCQQNFGEGPDKFIFLVEVADGSYKVLKKIALDLPKFRTVQTSIADCEAVERIPGDEYRFEIEATPDQIFAFKKSESYRALAASVKFKFGAVKPVKTTAETLAANATFEQRFLELAKTSNCLEAYENIFGSLS